MKNDFDEAYKHGYKLDKIVPENINIDVVNEWLEDQKVIAYQQNEGNFLLACVDEPEDEDYMMYSFMRFFNVGNTTHVSVDFQSSSQKEMIKKLTEMLFKRHTF